MKVQGTDYKGNQFHGCWNGKTYSSQEGEGLCRIYVDNNPVHITFAEKSRIEGEMNRAEAEKMKAKIQEDAERSIDSFFQNLGMKSPEAQYYALAQCLEYLKKYSGIRPEYDLKKSGIIPDGVTGKQVYDFLDAAQDCFLRKAGKEVKE